VGSLLPSGGLFTRLGAYTLQQDFRGCAQTSEEEYGFISTIILNNGTSFT